ncbi:malonate decarboxylase acyl carrier protein [Hydrogenophaga sp. PAMC20947]|uniref:malonate decarboxylase acyl carrier protein n=1 Tax=Hydrogenophaga sp. PAMC20947 TaxID=2565558 RepID=UPI00109E2A98|nr:malonate decarboxylase acyl carrier protein [Hydrogenophaga sp. PAMC20947]QCB46867.1 malonate decarboxylase acyl carrier protein [Hydrogenophaga sp. PAMC20947]
MNTSTSLETLHFQLPGHQATPPFRPFLVGVVGSGNLEVLFEARPGSGHCSFAVQTSARGFEAIWTAVLQDFQERSGLSDLHISIHDMGATPAIVSLRLQQGVAQLKEGTP